MAACFFFFRSGLALADYHRKLPQNFLQGSMSFENELSSWRHNCCGRRTDDDFGANFGLLSEFTTKRQRL